MPTTRPDMLELVGGAAAVTASVEEFHHRLLADPTLSPAFAGIDMGILRQHHILLLNYLLGGPGPQPVSAAGLRAAHLPHRVTEEQFSAVVAHLVASLPNDDQTQQIIPDIVERLNWLRPHVVYEQIKRFHDSQVGSTSDTMTPRLALPPSA